ncbi:MAG: glycosyltransferase [Muribaculaceae bacterium]
MDSAQLTIVIPVYNRATIVERTLASVAAQTLRPLSVVLVDNNSTDDTMAVLQRWAEANSAPDFAVEVITEPRPGAANARNAGLARVQTPWTMFFDSDDIMLPDHCASAIATAAANPTAQIIGWDAELRYPDGRSRTMCFSIRDAIYTNVFHSTFSTVLYMARTDLFRQVGGWLKDSRMFDDCELGNRLLLANPVIAKRRGAPTAVVYPQPDSISNTQVSYGSIKVALDGIEAVLPPSKRHWVDLQRIIKLAGWGKDHPDSAEIVREILARQPWLRRCLWTLLYKYALHSGRGVARIYRPFSYLGI